MDTNTKNSNRFPLIAPKSIWQYSELEYRNYIKDLRSIYKDLEEKRKLKRTPSKAPQLVSGISLRFNAKGTPVLTIRRKPQYITKQEIIVLAKDIGLAQNILWQIVRKRKIIVTDNPNIIVLPDEVLP